MARFLSLSKQELENNPMHSRSPLDRQRDFPTGADSTRIAPARLTRRAKHRHDVTMAAMRMTARPPFPFSLFHPMPLRHAVDKFIQQNARTYTSRVS
ncbi:hypothetical protein [Bradyrhizobium guangdongense]|uniref:hypothetical protein n=1 Tax=Bradyrhizobium guangdongense TaxID=1325090 RepID=UPI001009B94B|nr:hypothetical protein [Bradyrhizobium guangdongense]